MAAAADKKPWKVKWQYNDRGWQNFDDASNDQIESEYLRRASSSGGSMVFKLTAGFFAGKNYEFDCKRMKQINKDTGYERDVKDVRPRPVIGDKLMMRPSCEPNDVLKPGELGELVQDDRDSNPFKVRNPVSKKDQFFNENQVFLPNVVTNEKLYLAASLWNKYDVQDPECPDTIHIQAGLMELAKDLGVDMAAGDGYILAYLLNSTEIGTLRKFQVVKPDGIADVAKAKESCQRMMASLKASPAKFKEFWTWLFRYIMNDPDPRRKTNDFDLCVETWNLYLPSIWPLFPHWKKYISVVSKGKTKPLQGDVWECLLDFAFKYPSLDKFEDDGAWPSLFDAFFSNEGDWQSAP
jgi:hypothetical protein